MPKPGRFKDRFDFADFITARGYSLTHKLFDPRGNIVVAERYMVKPDDPELDGPHWKIFWGIERDDRFLIGRELYVKPWDTRDGLPVVQTKPMRVNLAVEDAREFLNLYQEAAGHA